MKLALALLAALFLTTSAVAATTPTVAWSKKDIQAAAKALGYPKPHPRKLSCKGQGDGSGGRYVSFRCTATYRHHRHTRFVIGGAALGGWLCAGKKLAACKPLRRGFVATDQLGSAGPLQGAAELATRGYMNVHYGVTIPNRSGPCTGAGRTWTCGYYITDTQTVDVTATLKRAKGGYLIAASTG